MLLRLHAVEVSAFANRCLLAAALFAFAPALAGAQLVERVVDGDTIIVRGVGRVRLIGVDTPETVSPDRPVEFFGREASAFTKRLLEGRPVRLEYDWERTDRYGRNPRLRPSRGRDVRQRRDHPAGATATRIRGSRSGTATGSASSSARRAPRAGGCGTREQHRPRRDRRARGAVDCGGTTTATAG